MAIISTSDYNTYAGISGQDTLVATLISGAQAAIERACGVDSFDSTSYTDQLYDGTGTPTLILRNAPITAVSSIEIRSGLADATPTTLESNTYIAETDRSGLIHRLGSGPLEVWERAPWATPEPIWPTGRLNVLVTYTAGYTSQTMPADLKQAMYRLVDALRARRGRDGTLQSESLGSYSWSAADADAAHAFLTSEVAALIAPYRRGGP